MKKDALKFTKTIRISPIVKDEYTWEVVAEALMKKFVSIETSV